MFFKVGKILQTWCLNYFCIGLGYNISKQEQASDEKNNISHLAQFWNDVTVLWIEMIDWNNCQLALWDNKVTKNKYSLSFGKDTY